MRRAAGIVVRRGQAAVCARRWEGAPAGDGVPPPPTPEEREKAMKALEESVAQGKAALKKQMFEDPEGPAVVHLHSRIGNMLLHKGTPEAAAEGVDHIRRGLVLQEKLEPGTLSLAKGYYIAGGVHGDLHDFDEAVACFEKSVEIMVAMDMSDDILPLFFTVHQMLAVARTTRQEMDQAQIVYMRLFTTLRKHATSDANFKELRDMHCEAAVNFQRHGRVDIAKDFYDGAIALSEDKKILDKELTHIYYLVATLELQAAGAEEEEDAHEERLAAAESCCRKGLAMLGGDVGEESDALGRAVLLNVLADVHHYKEDFAAAKDTAEEAVALLEEHDTENSLMMEKFKAYVRLGTAQQQLGNEAESNKCRTRAEEYYAMLKEAEEEGRRMTDGEGKAPPANAKDA